MSRSLKKQPYVFPKLLKRVEEMSKGESKKPIKTWSRASVIYPEFVGYTFAVYNGKNIFQFIALPKWLVINLANSLQQDNSKVMQVLKRLLEGNKGD